MYIYIHTCIHQKTCLQLPAEVRASLVHEEFVRRRREYVRLMKEYKDEKERFKVARAQVCVSVHRRMRFCTYTCTLTKGYA
jgi:hypothetical protein